MKKRPMPMLVAVLPVLLFANTAAAARFDFSGTITDCTETCASVVSLRAGSLVSGHYEILIGADGNWSLQDIVDFQLVFTNPDGMMTPYDGDNAAVANPLPLAVGLLPLTDETGGGTDAGGNLASGRIAHQFMLPPFASTLAWLILDIDQRGDAIGRVCLFYPNADCLPGTTQAALVQGRFSPVPLPGGIWLLGAALAAATAARRTPGRSRRGCRAPAGTGTA